MSMPLTKVNRKCVQCVQNCKQWSQVGIIFCPNFQSFPQKDGKEKEHVPFKGEEGSKMPRREANNRG